MYDFMLSPEERRIAATLHDDVGSGLSSISILSSVIEQKIPAADEAEIRQGLQQIQIAEDEVGLVEGAHHVLESCEIDSRLAAHRCVHHSEERSRNEDYIAPPHVQGRGKRRFQGDFLVHGIFEMQTEAVRHPGKGIGDLRRGRTRVAGSESHRRLERRPDDRLVAEEAELLSTFRREDPHGQPRRALSIPIRATTGSPISRPLAS